MPRRKQSARRAEAPGFTLIEVLVAFAIAALLLVPLMRLFSSGTGALTRSERAATAALWAQTVLDARTGEAPLAAGTEDGELPGGYHWRRTVALYIDATLSPPQMAAPLVAYDVTLSVSWSERGQTRAVTLETLKLAPPPRG
jgi:prepilin-type N-terminal cleavage/methylation domain-containing protein